MTENTPLNDVEGMAALSICESLLLALADIEIISEEDARDVLTDAATALNNAAISSSTPEKNQAVVEIVRRILAGKNGVRH